ncbi:MAG: hypothetical protein CVV64_16035 [Candidatus Wallbacteria bacterium HGW-Wallbacteria-1]|uniref:Uncharacterized protein n=1 Tax=Candidatus Wallbacteria bacterium HGW-Wallbacteria-1 TaxID=2013854 RepID=A0A2N1PL34_9BACT|nr:MAG: hypothetical protein CVV64_16035 [Candidatus Wallbacteria bacterium HGW-Wallbacteria-1]
MIMEKIFIRNLSDSVFVRALIFGFITAILLTGSARWAFSATVSDLVNLKKTGLSETVILTKLEMTGLTEAVTVDGLVALGQAGFSKDAIQRILAIEALGASSGNTSVSATVANPFSVSSQTVVNQTGVTQATTPQMTIPQTTRVIPYAPAQNSIFSTGSGIIAPGVLTRTELTIVNRNWRALRIGVDGDSGLIYVSSASNGDPSALGPMQSISLVVSAGEYMIVTEGVLSAHYFTVHPGIAELMVLGTASRGNGCTFMITQAGRQSYAIAGQLQNQFTRKVIIVDPSHGRGRNRSHNVVVVKSVSMDPISIFLRWGWNWPGHDKHSKHSNYRNYKKVKVIRVPDNSHHRDSKYNNH